MIAVKADSGVRIVFEALRCADLDIDEQRINEIMKSGYRIANFPDKKSHYNVDIIFSSEKIEKLTGRVAGLKTFLQKPEGLIAAKLRMIKATLPRERALKDEEDVKAILQFTKVDLDSIKQRAKLDGTQDILEYLIRSD
jgi:hypothetical protein